MATWADFFKAVSAATPTADAVKIFEQQFAPQVQVPFIPGLTDLLKRVSANTPSAEAVKAYEDQFRPQPYVPPQPYPTQAPYVAPPSYTPRQYSAGENTASVYSSPFGSLQRPRARYMAGLYGKTLGPTGWK